jgi:hypothetical protein
MMDDSQSCIDPAAFVFSADARETPSVLEPRPFCLLANDDAEAIKQTSIAFRGVIPGFRVEAVYSTAETLEWVTKENWPLILFAERLAADVPEDLSEILSTIRCCCRTSTIIVLGNQGDLRQGLAVSGPAVDYYCTPGLGHASADLATMAMHLIEKRRLRHEIHATQHVLRDVTQLLGSLTDYYEAQVHGTQTDRDMKTNAVDGGVPRKIRVVQETLHELIARLAVKSQERNGRAI